MEGELMHDQLKQMSGHQTVPTIYIGGKLIGGNDSLQALEKSGKLDELLKETSISGETEASEGEEKSEEEEKYPEIEPTDNTRFSVTKLNKGTGTEKVPIGQRVEMHYTGTLLDGTKFDSSRDRGRTFSFVLGSGQVIKCWDRGVAQLVKGQRAIFNCPAADAYGSRGAGKVIPPNATLKFDVEVIDF